MRDGETVAVFVTCAAQWRAHGVGDNRLAFLLRSLASLCDELMRLRVPIKFLDAPRFADVPDVLHRLCVDLGADAVHFNAEYPIDEQRRDDAVRATLLAGGIHVRRHEGGVMLPPGSATTAAGKPYTVYTPFKRRFLERLSPAALELEPDLEPQRALEVASDPVPARIDGVDSSGLAAQWPGGEREASRRLETFVAERIARYAEMRDRPGSDGTSMLSPYLSIGAISARRCYVAALGRGSGREQFRSELVWREFYQHVTAVFPHISRGHAFRREYDDVGWRDDRHALAAWKEGRTGYPLVDAGMRQLMAIGWMHNRVRMVTAMFLTKHLLIDWREGERHFMNVLVDGDFAANNGGWQWSASTGTDAAPYFRIFNPVTQAAKCDPDGAYVKRWVPELASLTGRALFEPWRTPLLAPGYPPPIVDHAYGRKRALATFAEVKR